MFRANNEKWEEKTMEGIELPNRESIWTLEENDIYK